MSLARGRGTGCDVFVKGAMKLAKDPLTQLNVLGNVSQQGKPVFDCYRLLYKEQLWYMAAKRLGFKLTDLEDGIKNTIEQLKKGRFRFQINQDYTLFTEVLFLILYNIYQPLLKNLHQPSQMVRYMQSNFQKHNWWIKGEIERKFERQIIFKCLKQKIADQRFLLLLHGGLKKKIVKNHRLKELFRDVFFYTLDQSLLSLIEGQYLRLQNQILIGFQGTKQQAQNFAIKVAEVLKKEYQVELSFTIRHIKQPLYFRHFKLRYYDKQNLQITVSHPYICQWVKKHHYGNFQTFVPTERGELVNLPDEEIIAIYKRELRQLFLLYRGVEAKGLLKKCFYLARGSLLKTLACKHRTAVSVIAQRLDLKSNEILINLSN